MSSGSHVQEPLMYVFKCFKEKAGIHLSLRKGKKFPDNPPKGQQRAESKTGDLCDCLVPISSQGKNEISHLTS